MLNSIANSYILRSALAAAYIILATQFSSLALAQVNVTGAWTGFSFAGGGTYANTFSLVQVNGKIFGSALAGNASGVITGTITGNQISFHSNYASINYSSDAVATTDGLSMNGTFLDSQGTSGTFTADKSLVPLTPNLTIADPPIVQLNRGTVKLTLQEFSGVSEEARLSPLPLTLNSSVQYNITVKGAETRKIASRKNKVTVKNLPSGSYTASYTASAIQNGKKRFSSKRSPLARFKIN